MTSPTRTFSIRLDWNNAHVLLFGFIFSYSIGKTRFRLIWLIKISLLRSYCVSTERGSVTLGDSKSKEAFCCIVVDNFERWRLGHLSVRGSSRILTQSIIPFCGATRAIALPNLHSICNIHRSLLYQKLWKGCNCLFLASLKKIYIKTKKVRRI